MHQTPRRAFGGQRRRTGVVAFGVHGAPPDNTGTSHCPARRAAEARAMSGNPLDNKSQAWSALFTEPMSELVKRYTASVDFDRRLWRVDIAGSLAHAAMLCRQRSEERRVGK